MKNTSITMVFRSLLAALALASCSTENASYCEEKSDCAAGYLCQSNACVANESADASAPEPDAAVDAGLIVCSEETHQCVPDSSEGWSKPALRIEGIAGAIPVECPTRFQAGEVLRNYGTIGESGSCSCSCGPSNSLACSAGLLEGRDGPLTLGTCYHECEGEFCSAEFLSPGVCSPISSSVISRDNLRFRPGTVTGGSCGSATVTNDFEEASFESQVRLCEAEAVEGSCEGAKDCTAQTPEGMSDNMCIYRAGEHECPSGSNYSNRTVSYDGLSDQRSCASCDCEAPLGAPCGVVELFSDDSSCSTPIDFPLCGPTPGLISGRVKYTKLTSRTCDASDYTPEVLGSVNGTGATTICCAQ